VQQSASLATIGYQSHILVRLAREAGQRDFIKSYGDGGALEFESHGGTIPQRLLLMNGDLVHERISDNLLASAAAQIAAMAPSDDVAVEVAFLAVLTRRPDAEETRHFAGQLAGSQSDERTRRVSDMYWALLNGSEFSWNH
jgi:hypothetical protein